MSWKVKLTPQAERDLRYWRRASEPMFKKCLQILQQLELDPMNLQTAGRPEWLRGNLSGCMSRRISRSDRCVYQVLQQEHIVKVLQMRFHYQL